MPYEGAPFSTRVIFPRPEGMRGLLIPRAHLIVDGVKQIVTPEQYAELRTANGSGARGHLQCAECGVGVNFTSAHRHAGTFYVPNHFKTAAGEIHDFDCGYHTRKAARDLGDNSDTEYDPSKPFRIHLNFSEEWIRSARLSPNLKYIFNRNQSGLPVTPKYQNWEPRSVTSLTDLVSIINDIPIERLLSSVVILNGQAIQMREFLMTSQSRNWTKFYNMMDDGFKPLRLFAIRTERQQSDLFNPPPSTLQSSQIRSDKNAPDFEGNSGIRSFALNPRLPSDPALIRAAASTGLVFVLSVPDRLKRGMKNNGCDIRQLSIPVHGSEFVASIPNELWQKMRPPVPAYTAT